MKPFIEEGEIILWRCIRCEKWSHAMKKPGKHKIWVADDGNERYPDNGHFEFCGPFRRWVAVKR